MIPQALRNYYRNVLKVLVPNVLLKRTPVSDDYYYYCDC